MFGLLTEVIFPGECGTLYNVNRAVTKQPMLILIGLEGVELEIVWLPKDDLKSFDLFLRLYSTKIIVVKRIPR